MVEVIQAMYDGDTACVRTPEGLTTSFRCNIGVKQGCPLSPNLFGLYLDELEKILLEVPNNEAPTIAGIQVPLLLYADDLTLLSSSQRSLQNLLDRLHAFCEDRGLTVNVEKIKVVVFGGKSMLKEPLSFKGASVEQVESFPYLGLEFHQNCSFKMAITQLLASARRATFALHSRCAALGIRDPRLKCHLFDSLVHPLLSYGCEIWSPYKELGEVLEKWHRKICEVFSDCLPIVFLPWYMANWVGCHFNTGGKNRCSSFGIGS